MRFKNLVVTLLLSSFCRGAIVQIDQINDLYSYLKPSTLVIFDIDNTLMMTSQQLGSDQWFCKRSADYQAKGLSFQEATDKALSEWVAIQSITRVKPVETGGPEVVRRIQRQGYTVIGLTTRGLGLSTRTVEQLHSIGIDLSQTAPTQEETFFKATRGVLFRGGILFTAGTDKGVSLFRFLDRLDFTPKSIVFINDKTTHLEEVEKAARARGIEFLGLRYSRTDEWVASFNPEITDIQLRSFGHILSDEEAEKLLTPQVP